MHTIFCSLHQNELIFGVVLKHLDGNSKSLITFNGLWESTCTIDYQDQPQVEYTKLGSPQMMEFNEVTVNDLSGDQSLFESMC